MTKRQAIFRILTTYLLVLLPLLVVSFFATQTVFHSLEQEQQAALKMQLDSIAENLDHDIDSYNEKAMGLMQMDPFSSGDIFEKPLGQLEAMKLLQKLLLFDGRVNDLLVYYGGPYLCGNFGGISPNVYFKTRLSCTADGVEAGLAALESTQLQVVILETISGDPNIMYNIPVNRPGYSSRRSVQFVFPISDLAGRLESILEDDGILIQMNCQNGDLWFYNSEDGCRYLNPEEAGSYLERMDGKSMQIPRSNSGIGASIWYNSDQQLSNYYEMRDICFTILAVGLLLSTILSVCLSFRRMSNIRRLANSIVGRKVSKARKKLWINNEFDYIQALVDESIKDGNLVRKNVKNYRHIILQQVAVMIFHGVLRDQKEIQSLLAICGTELVEEYYYLCGIRLEKEEDAKRLEPFLQEDLHYFGDDRLVVMLCQYHSYDHDMHHRKDMAARLISTLDSVGISSRQVVISQVYNHISMANYAYLEIRSIIEHMKDENETLLCWEDMVTQQERHDFRFDNEHLQMFYAAIEQKNGRQAEKMLDRIFTQSEEKSGEHTRYLRYMVMQALRLGTRSVFEDENAPLQQQLNGLELEKDENFLAAAKQVLKDYCHVDGAYDKIVQYVNDNYTQYDLSLEHLAAEANVSKAQMSKIFRAKTGVGYIDYVTNLRMEKARELLATTDLGVKDVFSQVGYIDSTNASKKFKAIYNITPSAYRSAEQKNGAAIQEDEQDV